VHRGQLASLVVLRVCASDVSCMEIMSTAAISYEVMIKHPDFMDAQQIVKQALILDGHVMMKE
jgi:hypothetical protein